MDIFATNTSSYLYNSLKLTPGFVSEETIKTDDIKGQNALYNGLEKKFEDCVIHIESFKFSQKKQSAVRLHPRRINLF